MSNWPNNTDLSAPNWTGRTLRELNNYASYSQAESKIPVSGWVLIALTLFAVIGFIPLMYVLVGK